VTAPLVPEDVVFTALHYVPIYSQRLFDSTLFAVATADEFRAAFCLWLKSWNQKPAGSLPNDDRELCYLAGLAGNLGKWGKVKRIALRHWEVCDDGRLYHPVVAELVIQAWNIICTNQRRTRAASLARWNSTTEGVRNGHRDGMQPNQTINKESSKNGLKNGAAFSAPRSPKQMSHFADCQCPNCQRWHEQQQRSV
jgi:hypothetical protein